MHQFYYKEVFIMDLLTGDVKKLYFHYLSAAFGSALIVAVYSIVDCAVVGQYEGSLGVAALATVAPVWNIIYSLGLLFGIGGAVLMSAAKGRRDERTARQLFTEALIGATAAAGAIWLIIIFFDAPMLRFFGADDELLPLARRYLLPVKFAVPLFLYGQFLAAFLRNDNAPGKATAAVLSGGIFNIVGDCVFVFVFHMGIFGAGLATALGQLLSILILCSHFFSKKCTLRLAWPERFGTDIARIMATGFSTFFIDIAMGILSLMFNNQIMRYAGPSALAVYGVIININTLVQACSYGIGQAAQPLISVNYGAGQTGRIRQTFFWSMVTTAVMSLIWTSLTMGFPLQLTGIFMKPDQKVLAIAAPIMRSYFVSFLLLPLNIFSTYYFQAIMKPGASFLVSVLRGLVISGGLIYVLPMIGGDKLLWFAMPVTELVVAVMVVVFMIRFNRGMAKG